MKVEQGKLYVTNGGDYAYVSGPIHSSKRYDFVANYYRKLHDRVSFIADFGVTNEGKFLPPGKHQNDLLKEARPEDMGEAHRRFFEKTKMLRRAKSEVSTDPEDEPFFVGDAR